MYWLKRIGSIRCLQAGHTKLRTGAIYPLATDLDFMIGHMNQMLFDNAMRPAIIQASKVFHDTSIRNAIYKYFGQAWEGELHDYIVGCSQFTELYGQEHARLCLAFRDFAAEYDWEMWLDLILLRRRSMVPQHLCFL